MPQRGKRKTTKAAIPKKGMTVAKESRVHSDGTGSDLERKFQKLWLEVSGGWALETQWKHDDIRGISRRLPFDFRISGTRILIEINGTGLAHSNVAGLKRDAYKCNMAQMLGFISLTYTTTMVTKGNVYELFKFALANKYCDS